MKSELVKRLEDNISDIGDLIRRKQKLIKEAKWHQFKYRSELRQDIKRQNKIRTRLKRIVQSYE